MHASWTESVFRPNLRFWPNYAAELSDGVVSHQCNMQKKKIIMDPDNYFCKSSISGHSKTYQEFNLRTNYL